MRASQRRLLARVVEVQKKYKGQKSMFIVLHLYHVLASLRVRKSSYFQANVSILYCIAHLQNLIEVDTEPKVVTEMLCLGD